LLIFIKMKKSIYAEIEIPEGVEANVAGDTVNVKGVAGELTKDFNFGELEVKKDQNKLILGHKKATKKEKKLINTLSAHIKNMISGVQEKFEYELKICFNHFPFTVDIQGNKALIKNFLGEKQDREVSIPEGAEIKIDKEKLIVTSANKELAGQAAANFENATKIRARDTRVFQDGIYITKKAGKEI